QGIVVSASGNQILVKKDTIEYNASSFKTNETDMLEELLKKLPGVEIDSDGKITQNGKEITKIMIDGKVFFMDDPQLASKNLPAKIIDKVRVVERKSDEARFTGIDDGEEETVIDLSVQKGMMNGVFGNAMAGGGHDLPSKAGAVNDWRWQGAFMGGRFTETSQISVIANANNTNNRGFNDLSGSMMSSMMGGGGGMGGGSTWTNIQGSYTQGKADGTGPTLTVSTTGSAYSSSSAKAIKAICAVVLYGGTTEVSTKTSGAEGLESKSGVTIAGGMHYFKCYDDCINSAGKIIFDGGVTVCYGYGNDSVDSNAGTAGAVTIGNGAVFAYSTKGAPEEGIDCDNNSYIQITGTGIGISAGAAQGGGSSSSTISNAKQGYAFYTSTVSYQPNRYYTLADANGNNLVTYSVEVSCSSSLSLFTATGMVKGSKYNVKYSTTAPTDATTAWHGLYLGSSHVGTTSVISTLSAK
ncbi:MAG: carbohydrate-binding domain-containing protein, partial [Bacteroidaceae bacterium]|nr:carbohydrate-binding domain-containing protein [Bacteroidaceae bacterium]